MIDYRSIPFPLLLGIVLGAMAGGCTDEPDWLAIFQHNAPVRDKK